MDNWKYIEEITNERDVDVIVYTDNKLTYPSMSYINIGFDGSSEDSNLSYLVDNAFIVDKEDILNYLHEHRFTRYALLTPPKTNQSNK